MATYYARAGGGNWTAAATWSLTSGGGATGSTPTAADECVFDANSGNVTINSGAVCRSWWVSGYTGTITHTAAVTLAIGDGTAGTLNVAVGFSTSGWTYTLGNASTSAISLVSTSATQQTITSAGKTFGNVTFGNTGSPSYKLGAALTCSNITFTVGTFNTDGQTITAASIASSNSNTRTLTLGSSAISLSGGSPISFGTTTNLTMTANTAIITCSAGLASLILSSATFDWNGLSFVLTSGAQTANIGGTGTNTIKDLTFTGTSAKTNVFQISGNMVVTGTFTGNGNSNVNRILICSGSGGSRAYGTTRTVTAANTSFSNADFMDITGAGAGNWNLAAITGNSGDCGGNSGITFTTPATQTATGTASFAWSTHGWTSRVPLPQDDVVIPNAFIATRVITADMPRLGKNITFSCTGNPTFTPNVTVEIYGSWTFASGMTVSGGNNIISLGGRSTHTITSNGVTFTSMAMAMNGAGGTYTMADALTISNTFNLNFGTFDTGGYTFSCFVFQSQNTGTRVFNGNSSTVNLAATTAVNIINMANTGGLTFNAQSATFVIANASANTRTIVGGGVVFGTLTYTVAGSTGELVISGSPWFLTLNFSDASNARTLTFTAGTSNVIFNLNVFGTSGKLMTVRSGTGGSVATITKPFGGALTTTADYLSVQDIVSVQPLSFFAGANSTNVSGNTNVIFTAPGTFQHSQSASSTATSTSRTTNWQVTPTPGTLLIARFFSTAAPGTMTGPAGYTQDFTKVQGVGTFYQWSKKADGTETSVALSWVNSVSAVLVIESYSGFVNTPTVDVTDSNAAAATGTSLSTTASTGPTNTAQPALATASYGAVSGAMGATTSITNSFQENRTNVLTASKVTVRELTSLAAVDSTLTWTTTRTDRQAVLVVYKDVASSDDGDFFLLLGY